MGNSNQVLGGKVGWSNSERRPSAVRLPRDPEKEVRTRTFPARAIVGGGSWVVRKAVEWLRSMLENVFCDAEKMSLDKIDPCFLHHDTIVDYQRPHEYNLQHASRRSQ